MQRDEFWHNHLALAAGIFAVSDGDAKTLTKLPVTPGFVKYWKRKLLDPTLHTNTWGGARNFKFDPRTQIKVEQYIKNKLLRNPRLSAVRIARKLQAKGYDVADQ
jgi:hypothetical protein